MADDTCSVDDCDSDRLVRGWCDKHYRRWRSSGDPLRTRRPGPPRRQSPTCVVDGCGNPSRKKSMCGLHYHRAWRGDPLDGPPPRPPRVDVVRPSSCAECGESIQHAEIGRPRRFCSAACKTRAGNRRTRRSIQAVPAQQPRPCDHCGKTFQPKRVDTRYCYDGCRQAVRRARERAGSPPLMVARAIECSECGAEFVGVHPSARWCSKPCQIRHRARAASRRRNGNAISDGYADREIFERDNWTCHLCGKQIDPATDRRQPDGATIDHVIPLSRGGTDTRGNVKTACNRCNRMKAARIEGVS